MPTISNMMTIDDIEPIRNPISLNIVVSSVDITYADALPVDVRLPVVHYLAKLFEPATQFGPFDTSANRGGTSSRQTFDMTGQCPRSFGVARGQCIVSIFVGMQWPRFGRRPRCRVQRLQGQRKAQILFSFRDPRRTPFGAVAAGQPDQAIV